MTTKSMQGRYQEQEPETAGLPNDSDSLGRSNEVVMLHRQGTEAP